MEFLNWKNILLDWANRLNYVGRQQYNLNMVEIEPFYGVYQTTVTSENIASMGLDSFMKRYFPQFQPSWSEEGKMHVDDYVYAYSLLMYFACVRRPDQNIQKIFEEMQEESQLAVTTFLQILMERNSFSRESVKCAIESSVPTQMSLYLRSPIKTQSETNKICPETPRSKTLNEFNVSNMKLKAEVETERYAKEFFQSQLRDKEDEVNRLNQERRQLLLQIRQMKSDELAGKENKSANDNHSSEESVGTLKRRLRKELEEKDAEVKDLQSRVDQLTNSNRHLADKLTLVQSHYNESVAISTEMAGQIETLTETCNKQLEQIKGLEININDYHKYFNESNSKGKSVETSSENLEDSFAIAMANMSNNESMSSPENLSKVVDLKLREQMALCESLQEKCAELNIQLVTANSELTAVESIRSDLVSQHEKILCQKDALLAEAETERRSLSAQLNELKSSVYNAEEVNVRLQAEKEGLVLAMEQKTEELSAELRKIAKELAECQKDRDSRQQTVADLTNEHAKLTVQSQDFASSNEQLQSQRDALRNEVNTHENARVELEARIVSLERIRIDLEGQLSQSEDEKEKLFLNLQEKIDEAETTELTLKEWSQRYEKEAENYQKQINELSASKGNLTQANNDLRAELSQMKLELETMSSEAEQHNNKNRQFLQSIEQLTISKETSAADLRQLQHKLQESNDECAELVRRCKALESKNQGQAENYQKQISELSASEGYLTQANDDLRAELSQMKLELETMSSEAEQHNNENRQFLQSIEQLTNSKETSAADLRQLQQKLQESNDECAELVRRCKALESENQGQAENYQKQISELCASEGNLTQANDDLRAELSQMKLELETMSSEAEQHNNENRQFLQSIEQLTISKETTAADLRQLQQKLQESNNECAELVRRCKALESENQGLTKSVEDLENKRDALKCQVDEAERKLVDSHEHLNQKGQEVMELSKALDELKSESATSLNDKSKIEQDLQQHVNLVQRLSEEFDLSKTDFVAKSQLVDSLRDEVEKLKAAEISMMTRSTELSESYETLVKELEVTESSRASLNIQCTSLTEELKAAQDKCRELENTFADRSLQLTAKDGEVKSLEVQVDSLKKNIAAISEVADREKSELNVKLQRNQEAMAAISSKAESEIEMLKLSIGNLTAENESLTIVKTELNTQQSQSKIEFESYQRSTDYKAEIEALVKCKETLTLRVNDLTSETEKWAQDFEKVKRENVSLSDENVNLATEIETLRTEYTQSEASNRADINSLKTELSRLEAENSANHQRIDELQKSNESKSNDISTKDKCAKLEADLKVARIDLDLKAKLEADLKVALTDLDSKIQECRQSQDIRAQLVHDNKILSAKLTQHRKMSADQEETWQKERTALMEQRDKSCTEIRFELEGKLNKMKERMKHIYTEETSKSKEKHDKQERELANYKNQCQLLTEKVDKYFTHVQTLSEQVYKLNVTNLELKKENEFLKSKLRLADNNPRESRLYAAPLFGSNIKLEMEDEQGEVFNNTYLADLKSGVQRTSPVGRESIRQAELHQRNSIAARHLRSTYAAQYGDQNLREEDISMPYFNDSMFSNQLDVRRGTLYQRPGPPTPSKNGGRLSFGGSIVSASDLFPKDILREHNTNAKTKTTPGKLMSMFSSSKHKEADLRKAITKPIYSTFTSSTPRQKSNWAKERKSMRGVKLNLSEASDSYDDDVASIASNDSLLSKTSGARRSITRRFSIISKSRHVCAVSSLIHKNRSDYRKKNHSKRQKFFEQSREAFLKLNDDDDENNFQLVLHKQQISYLQSNELFPLYLGPSEQFEILTRRTASEHPYSNEPTKIETVEASESSLTSSSVHHSKTMGNIILYGKIPRITVNETPQRELICLKQRSGSICFKLMDLTKEFFLVLVVIVACASYVLWNCLSRKNE